MRSLAPFSAWTPLWQVSPAWTSLPAFSGLFKRHTAQSAQLDLSRKETEACGRTVARAHLHLHLHKLLSASVCVCELKYACFFLSLCLCVSVSMFPIASNEAPNLWRRLSQPLSARTQHESSYVTVAVLASKTSNIRQ